MGIHELGHFRFGHHDLLGSLDYVTDQHGNLYSQDHEPIMQEELHSVCIFLAELEYFVTNGAPALAWHMDLYA